MASSLCTVRSAAAVLFLISAVPIAYLISLERATPATHVYYYRGSGFFRESVAWDDDNRRFLVSFIDGGVGQVVPGDPDESGAVLEEVTVVKDIDLAGNASLGLAIDRNRNRLLVAVADLIRNRYNALAAYDLSTWRRVFLAQLSGPNDEKSLADDVAVDAEGNAYVTDAKASKIWKLDVDGKLISTITSPLFKPAEWYKSLVALNGIVYHPDGFLLVIHTFSGNLYKIDVTNGEKVTLVDVVGGPLRFGDGLELLSPTELVVAGNPSPAGRLVVSSDGWQTASLVAKFSGGLAHRLASAVTVKDGRVYVNHIVGFGYPKQKHVLVEAVF